MTDVPPSSSAFSTFKDVLLFALAIYGAALSTFNWRSAVRKEKRVIEVRLSTLVPTLADGNLGQPHVKIEAVNIGHRPVTIAALTLEVPSGTRLWTTSFDLFSGFPDTRLPATLSDGQIAHLSIPYSALVERLAAEAGTGKTTITPVCLDTAGNVYRGKKWEVDLSDFARAARA
jgi:hypothetical protein